MNGSTRITLSVLVSVLVLMACTSDSESEDGAASRSSSTVTETPQADEPPDGWAEHDSEHYDDLARWLCHPDLDDDECDTDLDTTVIRPDGSREIETFEADPDAPIDCFYVYPTISRDDALYSDWDASPDEEGWVTVQQAARLASECRVFAPVYRQRTLAGLGGDRDADDEQGDPYADVLDAFRTYMASENRGRGLVLIGHSQGASILGRLLAEEFDEDADLREILVGAHLAGTSVAVPEGDTSGGDLSEIPLCEADDEAGCLTTWSTYAEGEVPADGAIFGRTDEDGVPAGCVNPASAAGDEVFLQPYLPAERGISILGEGDGDRTWLSGDEDPVETPFVSLPELFRGVCRNEADLTFLEVRVDATDDDPRLTDIGGRLTPEWGLHLLDMNLVMGDVVDTVAGQSEAFRSG